MNPTDQINKALESLKDFQRSTVDYVYDSLYKKGRSRFLIADEVGLGKTIVAKGIVAMAYQKFLKTKKRTGKKEFHVVYICSNQSLAAQNIQKLNFMESDDYVKRSIGRLIFLARQEEDTGLNFRISTLTPGTSFHVTKSTGYWEERALIFTLLTHYATFRREDRRKGLQTLLRGTVRDIHWWKQTLNDYYRNRYNEVRSDLFQSFRTKLRSTLITVEKCPKTIRTFPVVENKPIWDSLMHITINTDKRKAGHNDFQYEIIRQLRRVLTEECLEYLDADLYILDEFQRFKDLIDENNHSPAAQLAHSVFDMPGAKVLLLSATPFKPYTNAFNIENGEDHYKEFTSVLQFLMKKRPASFWDEYDVIRKKFFDMLRRPEEITSNIRQAREVKGSLESIYSSVMVRTERLGNSELDDSLTIDKDCQNILASTSDVQEFIEVDRIVQALNKNARTTIPKPVEYCKSTPYPMSFMDNYQLKNKLKVSKNERDIKAALLQNRKMWLNLHDVDSYKPIGGAGVTDEVPNGKLRLLMNESLHTDGWKLLWVTPTMPYYDLMGAYAGTENYSKTLVFSSWVMVPRMIATVLSYEVERLTIGNIKTVKEQEKATKRKYFVEKNKKRHPIPQLVFTTEREGRSPNNMTNFCLIYPSMTLSSIYNPVNNLRDRQSLDQIRDVLKSKLKDLIAESDLLRYCDPKGESSKWYWAAPLLLDRQNAKFYDTIEKWLDPLDFNVGFSVDTEQAESRKESKSKKEHLQELYDSLIYPEGIGLGNMPDDLEDVLVNMILASPAVCSYRALGSYFPDVQKNLNGAFHIALGLLTMFNKPESIATVRLCTEGNIYWQRVLRYTVDGNLQAMLDEYIYLLYECENYREIEKLYKHVTDVVSIRTSSIKVDDLNTFLNNKSKSMRCHYAMDFGNQKVETVSGSDRMVNLRQTFNSPFRPFVLASTSIGQEGLDFHYYCRKVLHWNLPGNPVDLEQREGRVNRYKGLCIRQNLASRYSKSLPNQHSSVWNSLFALAVEIERSNGNSDLVPYWHVNKSDDIKIERLVPLYAYSKDAEKYRNLIKILSCYRLTFGQPRQEELVEALLMDGMSEDDLKVIRDSLMINLSPFMRKGE